MLVARHHITTATIAITELTMSSIFQLDDADIKSHKVNPLSQGDNMLCGVYAVLNLLRLLYGTKFDHSNALLLDALKQFYTREGWMEDLLINGITFQQMQALLGHYNDYTLPNGKHTRMKITYLTGFNGKKEELFEIVESHIAQSDNHVAMLQYKSRFEHWTILKYVQECCYHFYDSYDNTPMCRKEFHLHKTASGKGWLRPQHTVLVEKLDSE